MKNLSNLKMPLMVPMAHIGLWCFFVFALCLVGWGMIQGDTLINLWSFHLLGVKNNFSFKIDIISSLMVLMITLLGSLIGRYSLRYLNGEKMQAYFYKYLLLTIAAVSILVLSNNLIIFFAMWFLSSLGIHKLLLYSPDRNQAVMAAWKKFFVSRFGDVALLAAIILTFKYFGTFDLSELFQLAKTINDDSLEASRLSIIAILFVLGAISKSAQFPFHFWLPETMETPAPVSALMHAGIINAGGFLIIRLSPILEHAEFAHLLLTFFGSITAVFGALVMITQNDIKKKLAFSTISQMGIMMVSCGLGAYSLALFHIIAHSFYKAHAFLSTGFLVEESKRVKFNHSRPSILFLILASLAGYVLITVGIFYSQAQYVAYFAYTAILMLGFVQNIDFAENSFSKMGINFFLLLVSILIFSFGICLSVESFLHERLIPLTPITWGGGDNNLLQVISCFGSYTIFVIGLGLSAYLIESKGRFIQKLYLYFWNGGYFTVRTNFLFNHYFSHKESN